MFGLLVRSLSVFFILNTVAVHGQNSNLGNVGNLGNVFNLLNSTGLNLQTLQNVVAGNPQGLSSLFQDYIVKQAKGILWTGLDGLLKDDDFYLSSECVNHTELFLTELTKFTPWALYMIDAYGKPESGILEGDWTWLGSYDECLKVEAQVYTSATPTTLYKGQYCKAKFSKLETLLQGLPIPPGTPLALTIGMCLPSTCNGADMPALANILLRLIPGVNTTTFPEPEMECKNHDSHFDTKAIAVIAVCGVILGIMVCGTCYDIAIRIKNWIGSEHHIIEPMITKYNVDEEKKTVLPPEYSETGMNINTIHLENGSKPVDNGNSTTFGTAKDEIKEYRPGTMDKLLLSFSVYTNTLKIMNTSQPAGALTAVNGIRFFSMSWVILGHSISLPIGAAENVWSIFPIWLKRLTFQAILNATFSVDTFFVLSGLLVSYLSLKEMKKRGGAMKFQWHLYYFHRFWRLTPPYMLFLMLYVSTIMYWGDGPMWPEHGFDKNECEESWWTNLLYINNLVHYKPGDTCMGWAWYLANDMQFFVVSPLMLIPLFYSPLIGAASCVCFMLIAMGSRAGIANHYGYSPNQAMDPVPDHFVKLYITPWCRIGPYAVGILTGYILYKTKCKVRIPKVVNVFGWLVAAAAALLILYGLFNPDEMSSQPKGWSRPVINLYIATSRTVWGACIAWVIFACATGYGGPINDFLSWSAWTPLSRLTYCAYLVHPIVMVYHTYSRRTIMHAGDMNTIYTFLGDLVLSYMAAFAVSLAFEAPMMGLEKVLLRKDKKQ